ncbi:hypothetical protein EJ08DRAFT_299529 [Tothia fuscella]|uniref:Uncharacterized protein n=1 Tax=Tothia fuscella TaxID=1048955 RepID=A0A9P4NNW9_9PEZI|nr:hypothetical protein EJ08DRAFT_299529 [Tothia fuscella]
MPCCLLARLPNSWLMERVRSSCPLQAPGHAKQKNAEAQLLLLSLLTTLHAGYLREPTAHRGFQNSLEYEANVERNGDIRHFSKNGNTAGAQRLQATSIIVSVRLVLPILLRGDRNSNPRPVLNYTPKTQKAASKSGTSVELRVVDRWRICGSPLRICFWCCWVDLVKICGVGRALIG